MEIALLFVFNMFSYKDLQKTIINGLRYDFRFVAVCRLHDNNNNNNYNDNRNSIM